MIGGDYCRMMARYNAWQNRQLAQSVDDLSPEELRRDRGAFFGSVLGTLNHIMWGDGMWMARFDGGAPPATAMADSAGMFAYLAGWGEARVGMDGRISQWADAVTDTDLQQDLTWYSGVLGREAAEPLAVCVTHMFNHQTHHRGQIHAMLTAAGRPAPVSDLFLMPKGD